MLPRIKRYAKNNTHQPGQRLTSCPQNRIYFSYKKPSRPQTHIPHNVSHILFSHHNVTEKLTRQSTIFIFWLTTKVLLSNVLTSKANTNGWSKTARLTFSHLFISYASSTCKKIWAHTMGHYTVYAQHTQTCNSLNYRPLEGYIDGQCGHPTRGVATLPSREKD